MCLPFWLCVGRTCFQTCSVPADSPTFLPCCAIPVQAIASAHPANFRLDYALSREAQNSKGGKMYIQVRGQGSGNTAMGLRSGGKDVSKWWVSSRILLNPTPDHGMHAWTHECTRILLETQNGHWCNTVRMAVPVGELVSTNRTVIPNSCHRMGHGVLVVVSGSRAREGEEALHPVWRKKLQFVGLELYLCHPRA